jgi:hypothetical protein
MDEGEVGFMDFPALLHLTEEGRVFFAPGHKEEAASLTVEPTDEGEKFLGIVVPQPVDQGESAVGAGGVNKPAGRFVHHEEGRMVEEDGGFHGIHFEEMCDTSKGSRIRIRIKMKMQTSFG